MHSRAPPRTPGTHLRPRTHTGGRSGGGASSSTVAAAGESGEFGEFGSANPAHDNTASRWNKNLMDGLWLRNYSGAAAKRVHRVHVEAYGRT